MSECLHCDINELIDKELANADADLSDVAAKVAEALADTILVAAPQDQAMLMADVISILGQMYLEKSAAVEGNTPSRRH